VLVAEAARELRNRHAIPFASACTDPCDGRTQGTVGMLDSLAYAISRISESHANGLRRPRSAIVP
jgi:dihydroxyacid dehydratase/phosphogluconate dehydratase